MVLVLAENQLDDIPLLEPLLLLVDGGVNHHHELVLAVEQLKVAFDVIDAADLALEGLSLDHLLPAVKPGHFHLGQHFYLPTVLHDHDLELGVDFLQLSLFCFDCVLGYPENRPQYYFGYGSSQLQLHFFIGQCFFDGGVEQAEASDEG